MRQPRVQPPETANARTTRSIAMICAVAIMVAAGIGSALS